MLLPQSERINLYAAIGWQNRPIYMDIQPINHADSHERFLLAMQATQEGIWDWQVGDAAMWLSPQWLALLGYEADALPPSFELWQQLMLPVDYTAFNKQLEDYIYGRMAELNAIHRFQHREGYVVYLQCRAASVRDEHGHAVRIVGVLTDVNERVHHENELQEARSRLQRKAADLITSTHHLKKAQQDGEQARLAAENANNAKSLFLAMMSHELRTPMTGVLGMVDLLMDSELDGEQQRLMRMLRNSATNLLQILNDILDFSKIEAGQLHLENIRFDLKQNLEEVFNHFQAHATEKKLQYSFELEPELQLLAPVQGDPVRLRQIISNLLSNAIKFTFEGCVKLQAKLLQDTTTDCRVVIEVRDSGIGLTADQQERIFNAFTQADRSTARRFGGTGLGLAIVKRLTEAMQGEIQLHSLEEKGSTFTITLPFNWADQTARLHTDVPSLAGLAAQGNIQPLRILLAEDNPVNQMLLTRALTRWGHKIDCVDDGAQAITALHNQNYDIVLMDMQMPIMDGASATRTIRMLQEPIASLPIIGISADAMPEDRQRHMAAGLDDYVVKPIDWQQLWQALLRGSQKNV